MTARLYLFFAFLTLALVGCAQPMAKLLPLPNGLSLQEISPLKPTTPVAVSRDGAQIAVGHKGLRVRSLVDGSEIVIKGVIPTALAFSPDGTRLAAAFTRGAESELIIFHSGTGVALNRVNASGQIRSLLWRTEGILAVADLVQSYKFGSNFQNYLYLWDTIGPLRREKIHDVTLDPITLKTWGEQIATIPAPHLSPWGDEILLARLIDPPAFDPYLKLVIRHLETGEERQVVSGLPLDGGAADYLAAGDRIIHWSSTGALSVDPWQEEAGERFSSPGRTIATSPGGEILWLDGKILRQESELLQLPHDARPVVVLADGRLFFRWQDRLWQLSGLPVEGSTPALDTQQRDRVLRLRKLRAQGLITPEEYLEQMKERNK